MTARRKGIIAASVVVGLLAWGGYRFHQFSRETRAEYHTAQTIDKVATFVETHQGRWPRSWDELGGPDYWRDGDVRIDFQADPDRLIDDPQLIYVC